MESRPARADRPRGNGRTADSLELPAALVDALQRLRKAEAAATGPQRRAAWRDTGQLLAAALELGYGAPALAAHIGTTPSSVRSRARGDEWLTVGEAARLLDVSVESLLSYADTEVLPVGRMDDNGRSDYHRRDVLVLLISGLPELPPEE
jgi:hypothetical protein